MLLCCKPFPSIRSPDRASLQPAPDRCRNLPSSFLATSHVLTTQQRTSTQPTSRLESPHSSPPDPRCTPQRLASPRASFRAPAACTRFLPVVRSLPISHAPISRPSAAFTRSLPSLQTVPPRLTQSLRDSPVVPHLTQREPTGHQAQ